MKFRIPQQWIFEFAYELLTEAGVDEEIVEADLESLVYEAGERNWDKYDDDYGDTFYYIDINL